MNWGAVGLAYAVGYAATIWLLGAHPIARLIVGELGLLIPPLFTVGAVIERRDDWFGRQRVFWTTIAAGAALWWIGQIAWTIDETYLGHPLPWFRWYIVVQLCASALPLIALVSMPHRGPRSASAATATLDICALACLASFLYWSLVIAPGMVPDRTALAFRTLAILGPLVRLASFTGFLYFAVTAGESPWAAVYRRIAIGMALAFGILVVLSITAVRGQYQTGSMTEVGWMLPFWFNAWAAATAPASTAEALATLSEGRPLDQPRVLFIAIVVMTVVGYGARYLMPLGPPIDDYRDLVTAFALLAGLGFVMIRVRVEQRAAEQANVRVRLLAKAAEQSSELIAIIQGDTIVYANDAFGKATGYAREELEALSPYQLVAPEAKEAIEPLRERLMRREPVRLTTTLARKDGSTFQAACAFAPIVSPGGRVSHVVTVVRDLTDELRLRDQLVRSERASAIGQLVSGVAHEINNPLQSLVGSLEVVLTDIAAPTVREDLERAQTHASRAVKIIRGLLAFVRKSPRERMLNDLNDIVRATLALRAYELERANIDVREDYGVALPLVAVNREEIQQIVTNLILNAEQAVASGARRGCLSIRTRTAGVDAVMEIADNGPGVPEAVATRIFEPFVTTRESDEATGLGLSIAYGIATAHGGTLELLKTDGGGACFRLTLPGAGFPGPTIIH